MPITNQNILDSVKLWYETYHKRHSFYLGRDYMVYSGYTGNHEELQNIVSCALNQWFTIGQFSEEFYNRFRHYLHVKNCLLVNSGSSANLLALTALTSPKLLKRRVHPGDEVITTACCFPTTIAPIIQNRFIPVFVDIDKNNFNILPEQINNAITRKTKAIVLTHSFGNPADMDSIMSIARKHNLWVIEDSCDSLGAKWNGQFTGTIGDMGTFSFYPAHHITTGEGGAVVTNNNALARILQSFRDWGRDCWCKPGEISNCNSRFRFKFGDLPVGYDHKYVFSHIGYNLKMTDMGAAIGVAQIKKLRYFIQRRNRNFQFLYDTLNSIPSLTLPRIHPKATPSWFSFPFTYPDRKCLIDFLESRKIQTRLIFSGNILKQPAFKNIEHRCINHLPNTDIAMNNSMFLGVYPGITLPMLKYVGQTLKEFFQCRK